MASTEQAALWERDREAYWRALDDYVQGWEGDEEERSATDWLAHSIHPDNDDIFRPRHLSVLLDLGFTRARLPNGTEYLLSGTGG